jgi:hypothetical protein
VITDSSGQEAVYPVSWIWNGCYVTSSLTVSLHEGSYALNLTNCQWMGCKSALPKTFDIYPGRTTDVAVSVFTGIV